MAARGRVRWRRFALIFTPAVAVAALLVGATAQGVIGASFVVSGDTFKLATAELRGQGFALAGGVVRNAKGQVIPVVKTGIRRAVATGLCQSVLIRSPLGSVTVRLTGGLGGNEVTVENMVVDVAVARTAATLTGIQLGRDAGTLDAVPGLRGPVGTFGGQGRTITLRDVRLQAWAVTAATFSLPDLTMKVIPGVHECF